MNTFLMVKEFLDKHPAWEFAIEIELEGIDNDETIYKIWLRNKEVPAKSSFSVIGPAIFENLEINLQCLFESFHMVEGP